MRTHYRCDKCGGERYETGVFHAAGGFWSKIFDIQNRRFTTIICGNCRYTEIYQADTGTLGNIFDFLTQ